VKLLAALLGVVAVTSLPAVAEHQLGLSRGDYDFRWVESARRDQLNLAFPLDLPDGKYTLVEESGTLDQDGLQYAYREEAERFALTYQRTQGQVAYSGLSQGDIFFADELNDFKRSATRYDIHNIEAEYGANFEVDYIKPYAALFGGYQRRQRDILPISSNPGLAEVIRYYYWGVKLEAELFKVYGLGVTLGADLFHTTEEKQDASQLAQDGSLSERKVFALERMYGLNYYAALHYDFMERYRLALQHKTGEAHLRRSVSYELGIAQPKSDQDTTSTQLALSVRF
jgi:hypothetical protein